MKIQEARARAAAVADVVGEMDDDQRSAVRLAATLSEIEHACTHMNQGAPGWELKARILGILSGGHDG